MRPPRLAFISRDRQSLRVAASGNCELDLLILVHLRRVSTSRHLCLSECPANPPSWPGYHFWKSPLPSLALQWSDKSSKIATPSDQQYPGPYLLHSHSLFHWCCPNSLGLSLRLLKLARRGSPSCRLIPCSYGPFVIFRDLHLRLKLQDGTCLSGRSRVRAGWAGYFARTHRPP